MAKQHDKSPSRDNDDNSKRSSTVSGKINDSKNKLPDFKYTPPPPSPKDNSTEKK